MRFPSLLSASDTDQMFTVLLRPGKLEPVVVSGFSQYKTHISDLPSKERAKIDALADRIIGGFQAARFQIVGVLVVGHADQDLSRGAAFEQNISLERAQRALQGLNQALQNRAASPMMALLAAQVAKRAVGNGAHHRLFVNPSGESQRAANRRVEIILAEGNGPLPPSAIPPQKLIGPAGPLVRSGLISASFVPLTRLNVTAPLPFAPTFTEGPPKRPNIRHDHGFLDDGKGNLDLSKKQAPTDNDRNRKAIWGLFLQGSITTRPDLKDANAAYQHFLGDNNGTPRTFNYEGFVKDDDAGKTVLESAIEDARTGILDLFDKKFPKAATSAQRDQLAVTSTAVTVGRTNPLDTRYPNPRTENWQKTIGGHALWLSADVIVESQPANSKRSVTIVLVLHADDRYNFNPGGGDGATGILDAENGRFEITGLGTEFLQTGTATRTITFTVPLARQADNRALPADQKIK